MCKKQSIIILLYIKILVFFYIYKSHIITFIIDRKYSKIYDEKYSSMYLDKLEKLTKESRYNRCVKNKIPKISGILETAQYLRYTNSSLVRFGDGEIKLMEMVDRYFQKANEELAKRLKEVFHSNISSLSIAILNIMTGCYPLAEYQHPYYIKHKEFENWILNNVNYSRQYLDAHITSPYIATYGTSCELVDLVYKELREIWRNKNIVILRGDNGEKYDWDVFDTAKSQKVFYGKSKEAWDNYEEYKNLLMSEDKDNLFILSIGPTSKVLAYDLVKDGRKVIDSGHLAKDYNCFKNGKFDKHFY